MKPQSSFESSYTQGPDLPLLDIIGNPTRRQILKLLSCEPHYASQIARLLKISQPAVVKQLKILEDNGLVQGERQQVEGEKGPERLYYSISKEFFLVYSISSYSVGGRLWETGANQYHTRDYPTDTILDLSEMAKELLDLENEILQKEQEITQIETKRNELMHRVSRLLQADKDLGKARAYLPRAIIRALIQCDDKICIEKLAKSVDKGESEVRAHLERFKQRGLVEIDQIHEDVKLST